MARTLFPHHRHINFDADSYAALSQASLWRRVSLSAYVRAAVETAARYDYACRGVDYPNESHAPLPGQTELFAPTGPVGDTGPTWAEVVAPDGPPSQGVVSPEGAAAVREFLALGRAGYQPNPALTRALEAEDTSGD